MQINMKKYHDITIEAYEQSSLDEDIYTPAKVGEYEAGSEGGPSPNHKKKMVIQFPTDREEDDSQSV